MGTSKTAGATAVPSSPKLSIRKRKNVEELNPTVPTPKRHRTARSVEGSNPLQDSKASPVESSVPSTLVKTKRASPTKSAPASEKRLKRFRTHPPQAYLEKLHRAQTQRMFVLDRTRTKSASKIPALPSTPLSTSEEAPHDPGHKAEPPLETVILAGTTGNVYTVTISQLPTCNCPDYTRNKSQCKHIIYVLTNILKVREDLAYQLAFLQDELVEILDSAPIPHATKHENEGRNDKRKSIEGDCPICFMSMELESHEELLWCKASCGQNVHRDCFEQWAKSSGTSNGQVRCIYCRAVWQGDEDSVRRILQAGGGQIGSEGYINVREQLGLSGKRDYSTYHSFWVRRQIRLGNIEGDDYDLSYY